MADKRIETPMKNFTGNLVSVLWEAFMFINDNGLEDKIESAYLFREKYGWEIIIHFKEAQDK